MSIHEGRRATERGGETDDLDPLLTCRQLLQVQGTGSDDVAQDGPHGVWSHPVHILQTRSSVACVTRLF